jgi:hypothetical protein
MLFLEHESKESQNDNGDRSSDHAGARDAAVGQGRTRSLMAGTASYRKVFAG